MSGKKTATLGEFIDQLDAGKWENPQILHVDPATGQTSESPEVITYDIGQPRAEDNPGLDSPEAAWSPMDSHEQAMAAQAFQEWDELIAPQLKPTSDGDPDISFNYYAAENVDPNTTQPQGVLSQENIWIPLSVPGTNYADDSQLHYGAHAFSTYIHEIGHSLGLNHPGNYNGESAQYDTSAIFAQDTVQYSVMSYFLPSHDGGVDNIVNGDLVEPQTPMLYDVAAVQAMYGADMQTRLGDTVYGFHSSFPTSGTDSVYNFDINTHPDITIYDAGGNDTLDVSGFSQDQIINLAPGSFSSIGGMVNNVSMAFNATSGPDGNPNFNPNAVIENAVGGSGSDTITGNDVANVLTGGAGNDKIDGGAGIDTAVYSGNASNYIFTFNADGSLTVADQRTGVHGWNDPTTPDGTDTLTNIEELRFADKTIDVSVLKNYTDAGHSSVILGGDGSDILSAQHVTNAVIVGGAGADTMFGGHGNDIFYVDNAGDAVSEWGNNGPSILDTGDLGGIDEVRTTLASYTLPTANLPGLSEGNIENLSFVGFGDFKGTGNSLANVISGGVGDDTLTGGGGNDTLDGRWGSNTAVYSGNFSDYKISVVNGVTTIADLRPGSPDGSDTLENIQLLKFADGVKTFNPLDYTAGSVSISDATITEGNSGSQVETFTLTRSGGNAAFDVNYATADGSATAADQDYVAKSSMVHFDSGVDKETISITVNGDTRVEANETYNVNLSAATNGATILDAQGIGTIVNDDTITVPQSNTNPAGSVTQHAADDFNGDGSSDVLFGNGSGQVALWEMNGGHIASNTTVGSVPAGWHIDATSDFGGDGKSDILLHNDNGQVAMWQMNGDHIASNTTVGSVGSDWHVAATGDFNGDGKTDILWENSKGQVAMWQMNGDHIASNTTVGSIGTDWHVAGTGDFNGDGKADILWENSKGQVAMWQMNGDHIASNTTVGSVSSAWQAAGVGDFNGDGKADVLWQNSNGQVAMWQMNGDHIAANTTVGSAAGSTVIGTGDYNHDGKADVLLQTASGNVTEWQMNGDHIAQSLNVGSHSSDWHMV